MKFFLIPLILVGCSTLKDEDCNNRNWFKQGFSDGERGYSSEMYTTYKKVCEQTEDPQTKKDYSQGYKEGAKKYCTYDKGVLVGQSGRPYPTVCPKEIFPDFNKGYISGKKKALK